MSTEGLRDVVRGVAVGGGMLTAQSRADAAATLREESEASKARRYELPRRRVGLRIAASTPPLHSTTTAAGSSRCSSISSPLLSCVSHSRVMQPARSVTALDNETSTSSPSPPCGILSNTRHYHLVAEPPSPHSPSAAPGFTVPLPLPPFPTLLLNPVTIPSFSPSNHCTLNSLLPCCTSDATVLSPPPAAAESMERAHHERDPVMEMRLTRSRARSLERQAEKQQQQQRKQRATSIEKRAVQEEERREVEVEKQPTGKGDNVFQADAKKDNLSEAVLAPATEPTAAAEKAGTVSPSAANKTRPVQVESLSDELAQARKEEGLSEFTGEHAVTPAPLQPPQQLPATNPATATPATTMYSAEIAVDRASQSQSIERKVKPSSKRGRVEVRAIRPRATEGAEEQRGVEEERKEAPASYVEETKDAPYDEDNRSLFSTALPSPLSPVERKESPSDWDKHDSALSFDSTSFSHTPQSYASDVDDKALAWQLQQEEYDHAAASRSIHTFLADMSYQPGWMRLSLAVCLVINVLLPLLFVPHGTAMVTLVCQVLQLGFAYWLYRVYNFTPHLLYSCALILPSLLYMVDAHLLQTGWSDVTMLGAALVRRPSLLLDSVVQLYIWQWMSAAVQAVELIGGMWLALKVR